MHPHALRLIAVLAFVVSLSWAVPLAAQQSAGQPAPTARRAAPRRAAPQTGAPSANNRQPRPAPPARVADQRGVVQAAGQGAPQNMPPQAPFTLTPQQQQLLNQVLLKWENESDRVKTFKCTFGRWEVNRAFGPANNNFWLTIAEGEIKFKAPDHGIYIVNKQQEWDPQKNGYVPRNSQELDHWVCNGVAIFEYNAPNKQLIERRLAPELKGKAITNGPLPFIFGAKANQLNRRYWMRDVTPAEHVNKQVWLEAWPKFQQDAANFQHAIVILGARDFIPEALRIILPDGKNMQDYAFQGKQVNDPLSILDRDFWQPRTPLGWTKVVEPAAGEQVAAPQPKPSQAERPAGVQRK